MESLRRFFTPLSYLRIQRSGKLLDELIIPAILTALTFLIFKLAGWRVPVFGGQGVVVGVTSYLQVVSGFYIASLAAIATFNKDAMDKKMAGDPPTLTVRVKGVLKPEELTRRRFLCFLFGYLSFISILLYFVGVGANLVAPHLAVEYSENGHYFKWIFSVIYIFFGYNLICTTLLGLYYMADRIHRVDPSFIDGGDRDK
ncbi:hypothetical protein [Pseudomonas peli]|uniref:hypothetical protein n=1 Tax=Pseudomonas peli TaxID=592361 RepID=UPI0024AD5611|nr:hypothetical protein [Pseudomonas peli]